MGRKIKPRHLKRDHVSISLPLDVIMFLDQYVARTRGTRSRYIESLVRDAMLKGQTNFNTILTTWKCSSCGWKWTTKDPALDFVFCSKCNKQQDKKTEMKSQRILGNMEEEE